jgi:hypothetical protein
MRVPRVIADLDQWTLAAGLGLMLLRRKNRIFVGYTGSKPGFLAAVFGHPATSTGVVILTNTKTGLNVARLAGQVLDLVENGNFELEPWAPAAPAPSAIRPLLGHWWSDGSEYVFHWHSGQLASLAVDAATGTVPDNYREMAPDLFVTLNGDARGEDLRVVRNSDGSVRKMYRALSPFTRSPQPFSRALDP